MYLCIITWIHKELEELYIVSCRISMIKCCDTVLHGIYEVNVFLNKIFLEEHACRPLIYVLLSLNA